MYGEGRIADMIQIFKKSFSLIGYVMTGAFLFLKDIAFIQFTRYGLIAKICHRGNSHQKEMCYDSSIRNKTAAKNNGASCIIKNVDVEN